MTHITIDDATLADLPTLHQLAHDIWWPTYEHVIPHGQISLMLSELYSEEALKGEMDRGGHFLIAHLGDASLGFAEYRDKDGDDQIMRMEKLYVDPRSQGLGVGGSLIGCIAERALGLGKTVLELNVNRGNKKAIGFYKKNGFLVVAETDTPYHEYLLDDYVMQKPLLP